MAGSRKAISPSIRWSVFARDGFTCRYCGLQAGQEGVDLVVDHVLSVVEGGDNRIDNLATACRTCNAGKSGKSLASAPSTAEVLKRVDAQAKSMGDLAASMQRVIDGQKTVSQMIVNFKCRAYGVSEIQLADGEASGVGKLLREFGPDVILEWYESAGRSRVRHWDTLRYLYGCAKKFREKSAGGTA